MVLSIRSFKRFHKQTLENHKLFFLHVQNTSKGKGVSIIVGISNILIFLIIHN